MKNKDLYENIFELTTMTQEEASLGKMNEIFDNKIESLNEITSLNISYFRFQVYFETSNAAGKNKIYPYRVENFLSLSNYAHMKKIILGGFSEDGLLITSIPFVEIVEKES